MSALVTYLSRHAQASLAAAGRIFRQPLGSLLTVLVIAIALTLPGILWLLVKNAQAAAGTLARTLEVAVYFKLDTSLDRVEEVAAATQQRDDVARVRVVSAAQGLAEFTEYSGFGAALDALESNPLPHVLIVEPQPSAASPSGITALRQHLEGPAEVEVVRVDGEWVERLTGLIALGRDAALALAALLALGVLVLMGNAIRLEIGARRAEIEVTKLVGGSNAFVRRPFLYLGFFLGLLGGGAALGLIALLIMGLSPALGHLAALYGGSLALVGPSPEEALGLLGGAATLGWLGAWVGAGRLIAEIEPHN